MALIDTINADIKQAMLAKEKDKLEALRAIKAACLLEQTKGGNSSFAEADEMKILQKLVKQRKDAATLYQKNGRNDLADKELREAQYIEVYLPKQLGTEELKLAVAAIIEKVGASGMQDMGKVMQLASKELAGRVDGKVIADTVKILLK